MTAFFFETVVPSSRVRHWSGWKGLQARSGVHQLGLERGGIRTQLKSPWLCRDSSDTVPVSRCICFPCLATADMDHALA